MSHIISNYDPSHDALYNRPQYTTLWSYNCFDIEVLVLISVKCSFHLIKVESLKYVFG